MGRQDIRGHFLIDDIVIARGLVRVLVFKCRSSTARLPLVLPDPAERAKAGRLHPPDVEGGTFTISNLGMYAVDAFQAIISPPQAAILAVGRIADRVVPVNGLPGIRPMLTLTLSSDHRVVDGAQAALFLNELAEALEQPHKWLS